MMQRIRKHSVIWLGAILLVMLVCGPLGNIPKGYAQDAAADAAFAENQFWDNIEFEATRDMDYLRVAIDDCNVRAYNERLRMLESEVGAMEGKLIQKYGRDDSQWPRTPWTRLYDRTKDMVQEFVREWERRGCLEPKNYNKYKEDITALQAQAQQLGNTDIGRSNDLWDAGKRAIDNCDREAFYRTLRELNELLATAERKLQESIRLGIYLGQHGHYENYYLEIRHIKDIINDLNEKWRNKNCPEGTGTTTGGGSVTAPSGTVPVTPGGTGTTGNDNQKPKETAPPQKPPEEKKPVRRRAMGPFEDINYEDPATAGRVYMDIGGDSSHVETVVVVTDPQQPPKENTMRIPMGLPRLSDMILEFYGPTALVGLPNTLNGAESAPAKPNDRMNRWAKEETPAATAVESQGLTHPVSTAEETQVHPAPAMAQSSFPATPAALDAECQLAVDQYKIRLRKMVTAGWHSPRPASKGRWMTRLKYDLMKDGRIDQIQVVQSSGDKRIDESAMQQVRSLQGQFGPLPDCYKQGHMGIDHDFTIIYE